MKISLCEKYKNDCNLSMLWTNIFEPFKDESYMASGRWTTDVLLTAD